MLIFLRSQESNSSLLWDMGQERREAMWAAMTKHPTWLGRIMKRWWQRQRLHSCFASYIAESVTGDEFVFDRNTFHPRRAATETT